MSLRSFLLLCAGLLVLPFGPAQAESAPAPQKVIFDTDFGTFNDDGQSLTIGKTLCYNAKSAFFN